MTEMVVACLCGCKEQARRTSSDFQGIATQQPVQTRPIRRTLDWPAPYGVKALDRGINPALRTFPCMACPIERHFNPINGF